MSRRAPASSWGCRVVLVAGSLSLYDHVGPGDVVYLKDGRTVEVDLARVGLDEAWFVGKHAVPGPLPTFKYLDFEISQVWKVVKPDGSLYTVSGEGDK